MEQWDCVFDSPDGNNPLERTKVPGGWLYRTTIYLEDADGRTIHATTSLAFVPEATA